VQHDLVLATITEHRQDVDPLSHGPLVNDPAPLGESLGLSSTTFRQGDRHGRQ
jgi:hypothetical protein